MGNMIDVKRINLKFLEKILKELPVNIFFKDIECKYVFATHYWKHLNIDPNIEGSIKGKTDLEIRVDKENALKAYEEDKKILATGVEIKYTIKFDENNELEYLEIIKKPVYDENNKIIGIVGLISDVTERVNQEQLLEQLANKDQLTGLYNRSFFDIWVNTKNTEELYPLTIIMGDCNNLKLINDTFGHIIGDKYIKKTASIMQLILPTESLIFRLGGDEFLAVLPNTDKKKGQNYIEKMNKLSRKTQIKKRSISVAFGLSSAKEYKKDLNQIIKEADKNMYKIKEQMHKEKK